MGRKRRGGGPEALPRLVPLLQLLLSVFLGGASGYRNVGCVFNKSVCKPEVEYCFRDQVFGRCVQFDAKAGDFDDFYRYNLTPDQLELLRVQLEQLEYEGYNWLDYYTQCVMKILLDDLRYGTVTDVAQLCHHLKLRNDNILDDENEFIVKDVGSMKELEPVATVKFTPSRMNPHGEFADEFYYPTEVRQRMEEERRKNNRFDDDYDGSVYDKLGAIGNPDEVYRRGSRSLTKKSQGPSLSKPYTKDNYGMQQEYLEALVEFLNRRDDDDDNDDNDNDNDDDDDDEATDTDDGVENETEDNYDDEDDNEDAEDFENTSIRRKPIIQNGIIIPVGRDVMRTPKVYDDLPLGSNFDDTIWRREIAGFKRRERLDVKKPGPPFSTNNYAFKVESSSVPDDENNDEDMQDNDVIYLPQVKKEIYNSKLSTSPKTYESVDLDYVYIQFNQEFHSWSEGERVVNLVGSLIGLQPGELKDIRVGRAEVTFKVPKNSKNYNATYIVHKIADSIIDDLHKQLNIDVVRAGIGDKAKLPAILEVTSVTEINSRVFGAWVAAGVAAVSAAAVVILIIARRHAKSRAKLAGVRTPDPEASKDYQDLCRARMQAKQSDKVNESPKAFDFGRLIESGRSESNRSSTSSWSEEPQVTNMDIATGHVVLSYMEDHLKNQDKLDEEWAALCAYEAEPCSTAVAEAEGNAECNRPGAALPYDHSRVILNDLANLNNSDYINASTITDHDPRNPAYIATQGPLPQTTADFWQLVWEQGSVVIVMLTRLTEEGQAMCHRYWPEEGSELYHIYEVHLVSELIWCEDYLVRSFYLKNLRTGETRTVTQFHFLSWSQNGVPQSTKALLEFRRKVNKSYRGRSCPIIVHCSDGAGRTGTYCLIDMVLNRMAKGTKEIDIAATLEHIRDQRADMVATKQQFEFVLIAVAEEVHAILKSLPIVAEKSTTTALSSTNASANKSNASSQSATQSDK